MLLVKHVSRRIFSIQFECCMQPKQPLFPFSRSLRTHTHHTHTYTNSIEKRFIVSARIRVNVKIVFRFHLRLSRSCVASILVHIYAFLHQLHVNFVPCTKSWWNSSTPPNFRHCPWARHSSYAFGDTIRCKRTAEAESASAFQSTAHASISLRSVCRVRIQSIYRHTHVQTLWTCARAHKHTHTRLRRTAQSIIWPLFP